MLSNEEKTRYSRQTILPEIGIEGQERLKAAKVLVAGAGGLGCPVLQYLAAAGVGTIGIADGDIIEAGNLQRQILYTQAEIGSYKAAIAQQKLQALNPHCTIHSYTTFIDEQNAAAIISAYDIVVDGTDNFASRYLLNDACVMLGKPLVSGSVFRFEGQVSVFNYQNGPTYRCLFPEAGETPNCAETGVMATLPGITGTIQANEVIKIITGAGDVLSGKLLVIDALTMQTSIFHFCLNEANRQVHSLQPTRMSCAIVSGISYEVLQQEMINNPDLLLIDVREWKEHAAFNIGGKNIPLSLLEAVVFPDLHQQTVVYCASGVRSDKAAKTLLQKGFTNVYDLKNGIGHLISQPL